MFVSRMNVESAESTVGGIPGAGLLEQARGSRLGAIVAAGVLVVVTLVAYQPALSAGFVVDDVLYVTGDSRMESLDGLRQIWTQFEQSDHQHQYYPMTSSAFWIQHWLWGKDPFGYHLFNVLLHAINAVLLWRLLRWLGLPGAWIAAAIFAVHPVHVQSVAWIAELKNVLSTLFFLSSALVFVRFLELGDADGAAPAVSRRGLKVYGLGTVLFVCALLAKTATCLLPVALLILRWWKRPRLSRRDLLAILPLVVLGSAFVLMTVYVESHYIGAQGEQFSQSWIERCLISGRAAWFYAGKLVWPSPLAFLYPRWAVDPGLWWQYLFPAAATVVVGGLWVARKRIGKGPLAAVAYFLVAAAPVSFVNVAFSRLSYVADHWQYWASIGLIALAAVGATKLPWRRAGRWAAPAAAALMLTVLSGLTWQRTHVFESERTLWSDTLRTNPGSWEAHYNLGIALVAEGELDEAISHYRQALAINADSAGVYNNLAIALGSQGNVDEAISHFQQALRIAPRYADARNNLGAALQLQGKLHEAIGQYREALRINPDSAGAHYNLGTALRSQGRLDEAIRHYRAALQLAPSTSHAHSNLGAALKSQGKLPEAIGHYREALRMNPDSAVAHYNLAIALRLQGKLDEAISHFRQVLQIEPDAVEVHNNLGTALAAQGRFDEAIRHYQEALRIDRDHVAAQENLSIALSEHAGSRPD